MPTIATDLFGKLTEIEKEELKSIGGVFNTIKFTEYTQKAAETAGVIKIIFDGFNIKDISQNISLWDSFRALLKEMFKIAEREKDEFVEVQVWIRDTSNPSAMNITFSAKQGEELSDLLLTLRGSLDTNIFALGKEKEPGKLIFMGFDKERRGWTMQIL